MQTTVPVIVVIDCQQITDSDSFHDVFAKAFGFPDFYGRNMAAWIDCLTSLDCPEDGMSSIHVLPGQVLTLSLQNVQPFKTNYPEIYDGLIECAAFVNWRRNEMLRPSVIALAFHY